MFCVFNLETQRIIGIHSDELICEEYINLYERHHPDANLEVAKIKKKMSEKFYDLYLVRLGDSYIPEKFIDAYKFFIPQIVEDHKKCIEIMMRVLEVEDLSKKDKRTLTKAIEIINCLNDSDYIPDENALEEMNRDMQEYYKKMEGS